MGEGSSRRPALTLVSGGLCVACVAWFLVQLPGPLAPAWVSWAPEPVCCLITWLACRRCWRDERLPPHTRSYWRRFSTVPVLLCGTVLANVDAALAGPGAPRLDSGPLTILLALAGQLAALWAFARLPGNTGQRIRWSSFALDSLTIGVAIALLAWYTTAHPFAGWTSGPAAPWWAMSLICVGFVGIAGLARITMSGIDGIDPRSVQLLGLAALAAAANGPILAQLATRPYLNGSHVVVPLVCTLLTMAASLQRADPPQFERHARLPTDALSMGLVIAVAGLLIHAVAARAADALIVAVGVVVVIGLVTARQTLAYIDSARLMRERDESLAALRRSEQQLIWQATHDALTGLANRGLFYEQASAAVAASADVEVLLVDLDGFKQVNDRLGHPIGDLLLVEVGTRLRACVRDEDLVARLGGDEFAVLLSGVTHDEADVIARRVVQSIGAPFELTGALTVGASVGVAGFRAGTDVDDLLSSADLALYAAKHSGKGTWVRYQEAMGDRLAASTRLAEELRAGLDNSEFELFHQPIVALADGTVRGVECVLRWHHPARGLLLPADFLAVAEDSGLIVPLGRWVVASACRQIARWRSELPGAPTLLVSVNSSARELREPDFVAAVGETLALAGLPGSALTVEVSESALLESPAAVDALHGLRTLGVRVALDGFGAGHSSLGLLRDAPVEVVKLDRSIVESVGAATDEPTIGAVLARVAEEFGLTAIAVGVETGAQAGRLRELGYPLAQGYHYARPLPADQLTRILRDAGTTAADGERRSVVNAG